MDYEKGSPAWDIGQILTRHASGHFSGEAVCIRVKILRENARQGTPTARLRAALAVACNCGAGESDSERSSIIAAEKKAAEEAARKAAEQEQNELPAADSADERP